MNYQTILQEVGLSEQEAKIYLTGLLAGPLLAAHLAEKAQVKRSTLYKILPNLKECGLFSETSTGKRKLLIAEDASVYIEKKKEQLKKAEEIVPELSSVLQTTVKPKVIFYAGNTGLRKLYMDTLKQKEPIYELVSLEKISTETESHSKNYYIPQRINKNIPIKIIVSGKIKSRLLRLETNPYELREVRVIEGNKFPIPLDCYIYGNKVAFALYRIDSEPAGIILESSEIATTMKTLFKLLWPLAKNAPTTNLKRVSRKKN
jgi:sugar-specific transcriptional regulator TrmB